jgi:hypothetical protein
MRARKKTPKAPSSKGADLTGHYHSRVAPARKSLSLHEFLSQSPLADLDFEQEPCKFLERPNSSGESLC